MDGQQVMGQKWPVDRQQIIGQKCLVLKIMAAQNTSLPQVMVMFRCICMCA